MDKSVSKVSMVNLKISKVAYGRLIMKALGLG